MNQETEKNINEAIDWLQETGASVQDFAVDVHRLVGHL
jgi:hypothetical protein